MMWGVGNFRLGNQPMIFFRSYGCSTRRRKKRVFVSPKMPFKSPATKRRFHHHHRDDDDDCRIIKNFRIKTARPRTTHTL